MFIVGDEIRVTSNRIQVNDSVNLYNKTGIIVRLRGDGYFGIDFKENIGGHDCDGGCLQNRGWYIHKTDLDFANNNICRVGIGNRLSATSSERGTLTGTVKIVILSEEKFAFEYDEPIPGCHSCDGYTKDGHGKWFTFKEQRYFSMIPRKDIKIGDIVKAIADYGVVKKDMIGIVLATVSNVLEISWFGLTLGHDCGGKCTAGQGYNVPKEYLEKTDYSSVPVPNCSSSITIGSVTSGGGSGFINVQGATNTTLGDSLICKEAPYYHPYDYPKMQSKKTYYHPSETELSFTSKPLKTNHIHNTKEIEDLLLINI